jgi:hypothetical protein
MTEIFYRQYCGEKEKASIESVLGARNTRANSKEVSAEEN